MTRSDFVYVASDRVRQLLADRPSLVATTADLELLEAGIRHPEPGRRYGSAINPKCTVDLMMLAATSRHWNVRAAVMRNPNVPIEILYRGLADRRVDVRTAAVTSLNCTVELLTEAMSSKSELVRIYAAKNPNCSAELLDVALSDNQSMVRWAALKSPNRTVRHLERGLADRVADVRFAVVQDLDCPAHLLSGEFRRRHSDIRVRQAAAAHRNCTVEVLDLALRDADGRVRRAAVSNSAVLLPEELRIWLRAGWLPSAAHRIIDAGYDESFAAFGPGEPVGMLLLADLQLSPADAWFDLPS